MTDTTQDQQFRTTAAKRLTRLCATRQLRWTGLEVLPPLKATRVFARRPLITDDRLGWSRCR